jgi:hypothetical protein
VVSKEDVQKRLQDIERALELSSLSTVLPEIIRTIDQVTIKPRDVMLTRGQYKLCHSHDPAYAMLIQQVEKLSEKKIQDIKYTFIY